MTKSSPPFFNVFKKIFLSGSLLLLINTLFVGCGENESNTSISPTYNSLYTNLFQTSCASCHAPGKSAYDVDDVRIDFSSATNGYTTLYNQNVNGATSVGTCSPVKIVNPGNVNSSYILGILLSDYRVDNFGGVTGCTPLPLETHSANLTTAEQSALVQWIQNGALND